MTREVVDMRPVVLLYPLPCVKPMGERRVVVTAGGRCGTLPPGEGCSNNTSLLSCGADGEGGSAATNGAWALQDLTLLIGDGWRRY